MSYHDMGGELEPRMESFCRLNGYDTVRNDVREGRSGARHEVDILATNSDGVTEFAVLVECKAWDAPIAKEVVSKVSMVMADLGVHKGIVVTLTAAVARLSEPRTFGRPTDRSAHRKLWPR